MDDPDSRVDIVATAVADLKLSELLAATTTEWAAATTGAQSAAALQLASGKGVIAIGGWNGGDPAPTLEQFQQYVQGGRVAYYVEGGGRFRGDSDIADWVATHYQATTVGGTAVYDLRSHT